MPVPGSVVGDWKLTRELGRGTTSIVFAAVRADGATPPVDGSEVALKLALPGTLRDESAVDRFLRGAAAQRTLAETADGVLPVLDVGTDHLAGPFLVTPLVAGPTLGAALAQGELPAPRALQAIVEIGAVLDAAASAGLVHRDVKPSNVLLGPDRAWLADFGLARDHDDDDDPTMTGAVAGTLAYLAPELVRGANASPASDRYALACLAFQALTGTPVFPRPTDAAILYAHVDEAPPRASDRRPALPAAVDSVLAAGLAKDPAQRPASATAFAVELTQAVGPTADALGSPTSPTNRVGQETLDPAPPSSPTASPAKPATKPARSRSRRPLLLGTLAAGLLMAAAAFVALTATGDAPPPARAASVPAVGAGLVPLGSSLASIDGLQSRDCEGAVPNGSSPACTLLQRTLPGRQLVVPAKGLIRAWTVRGASGELTLQILRSREGLTYQVSRAETVRVPTTGAHRFETELEASAGDLVAVDVAPGSAVGLRDTTGATTERWTSPVGSGSGPGRRSGLDREVMLRAELDVGAVRTLPRQLTGTEAESAPDGRELAASSAALPDGREVRVALRLVEGKVVLDLERGGKRRSRLFVPRVNPAGHVVELHAFESPGNASQLNFAWRNPGELKDVEQYFGLEAESLEAYT